MGRYASKVVEQAQAWLGRKESDGSHKEIIDIYNAHKPLARGYAVNWKSDPWCATFVSSVAIKLGYTDIIPTECSCTRMIDLFKKIGSWIEDDAYRPAPGDIIFYDWDDSGKGDSVGDSEHVGIVEEVSRTTIVVIEGNKNNAVERRYIEVNARYIRGYGVPKYSTEITPTEKPATQKIEKNSLVMEWQRAAVADGFSFPRFGIDGEWGAECESVATKALVQRNSTHRNLNKIVQKCLFNLGYDMSNSRRKNGEFDGIIGNGSVNAIKAFQKAKSLSADGIVGINTWKKLLGV